MLKSAVIEEKKFKHNLARVGADNPLGPKVLCQQEGSFVASLKRISSTSDFIHIFSKFNKYI